VTPAFRIPVTKLHGTLIVSLPVTLSEVLLEQLKADVGHGLEAGARGLVLDLSAVDLLDSFLSRTMRDLALLAGLMGVPTVMCGMDPTTAVTLVEMGLDLSALRTALDLEAALADLRHPDLPEEAASPWTAN
jgi:rsbT antagonist protein RsbS